MFIVLGTHTADFNSAQMMLSDQFNCLPCQSFHSANNLLSATSRTIIYLLINGVPKPMQPEALSFQQLTRRNGGILLICRSERIIKLELVGTVDLEEVKYMIGYTFQQLKLNRYTKFLINKTNPHKITDEANSWMKDFLLDNRHRFELKLTRVAIVTPESKSIGLYAHFMKTAFQVIFPGVKIASFEFEDSAVEWIK